MSSGTAEWLGTTPSVRWLAAPTPSAAAVPAAFGYVWDLRNVTLSVGGRDVLSRGTTNQPTNARLALNEHWMLLIATHGATQTEPGREGSHPPLGELASSNRQLVVHWPLAYVQGLRYVQRYKQGAWHDESLVIGGEPSGNRRASQLTVVDARYIGDIPRPYPTSRQLDALGGTVADFVRPTRQSDDAWRHTPAQPVAQAEQSWSISFAARKASSSRGGSGMLGRIGDAAVELLDEFA